MEGVTYAIHITRNRNRQELTMTHTTVTQNRAHRNDIAWHKATVDRTVEVKGEWWVSEYMNPFTGQTIRKSGRMTGRDWFVFDANGAVVVQYAGMRPAVHSLTEAKRVAAEVSA